MNSKIPKEWILMKLGEICENIIGGGTPSTKIPEYFNGEIIWLTPTEIDKNNIIIISDSKIKITRLGLQKSSAKLLPKGTVLLTSRASIGYVAIAGCELCTNQGFASFICKKNLYNFYLAYWLKYNKKHLENFAKGTTFKEISKSIIRILDFPLSPLPEQNEIVNRIESLFSKIDAGVDSLKKTKEQIKIYRQTVLKWAFEGKLTNVSIPVDANGRSHLQGWKWVKLGEVCEKIHYGFTAKSSKNNIGPKLLRITDIQKDFVDWDNVPYCKIDITEINKYILNIGDIVFARSGATVGKTFLIDKTIPKSIFASYLIRIIVNNNILPKFLFYFFKTDNYWKQIKEGQIGIGQPNFNGAKLSNIIIPLPPFSEQQTIVSEIERRFSAVDKLEQSIDESLEKAKILRQSILKKAFNGELTELWRKEHQELVTGENSAERLLERIKMEKE